MTLPRPRRAPTAPPFPLPVLLLVALLAGLGPAGCGGPVQQQAAAPDRWASCYAELRQRGADFDVGRGYRTGRGCGIDGAVMVRSAGIPLSQPAPMTCPLALALTEYAQRVVQPAALISFGQPVVRLDHLGTYNCRPIAGSSKMSEHAYGRAIDIAAFVLADGRRISVLEDWQGTSPLARFLWAAGQGACRVFSVVLTPNSNRDHENHLHLDIGASHLCETRRGRVAPPPDPQPPGPQPVPVAAPQPYAPAAPQPYAPAPMLAPTPAPAPLPAAFPPLPPARPS